MEAKDKILNDVLDIIKKTTTEVSFNAWFQKLELHAIDEALGIVYLGICIDDSNNLALNIIKNRYITMIEDAFDTVLKQRYRVIVKNREDYLHSDVSTKQEQAQDDEDFSADKVHTFANFVVGDNNKYAYSAAFAVAESPGELYNPLFIYGESGLGKTHLLKAIGGHIRANFPEKKILSVSSEKFTNELIHAIGEKQVWSFKAKYRGCDVLIIDDIQFFEGKEKTQEEFFHTFNTLHEAKKQIIISSDKPPSQLKELDNRLQNRFQWNLMAEVQAPDFDTRVTILTRKAEKLGLTVDEDLLEIFHVIANVMTNNVRELEGALIRLEAFAKIFHVKIDMDFARKTLTDIFNQTKVEVTPDKIKNVVCRQLKVSSKELNSDKRTASVSRARQIAMYLVREMTDLSLPRVGECFNGKHYTTVKYACEKIEEEIKRDETFRKLMQEIEKIITEK